MGCDPFASGMGFNRNNGKNLIIFQPSVSFSKIKISLFWRSPNSTYQISYRKLPPFKPNTSFDNADIGLSHQYHHVGCISAEPLVVPVLVVVYIEERTVPPAKTVFHSREPHGSCQQCSIPHCLLPWLGPSHQQDDFTGFQCLSPFPGTNKL